MRRLVCVIVVTVAVMAQVTGTAAGIGAGAGPARPGGKAVAGFEGGWIDLSKGWGPARACLVYPGRATECFRTEAAMLERAADLDTVDVTCSTPLKLHDGTFQTGATVSVYSRGLWIDLSTVGFDNRTSSYTVGACAVELASAAGGGGAHYTRCLAPGCVENTMDLGWNNVVSSVYLH